jgi:hypothetical protein
MTHLIVVLTVLPAAGLDAAENVAVVGGLSAPRSTMVS